MHGALLCKLKLVYAHETLFLPVLLAQRHQPVVHPGCYEMLALTRGEIKVLLGSPLCQTRSMVPESRDVILSTEEEKALWQTCFTAAPARRRKFEPSFPKVERKDQHLGPALWAESHYGYQVAYAHYDQRCAHGSGKAQKHGSLACRRGGNCGVQKKNAAAFG